MSTPPSISVIIPTLNEAERIAEVIDSTRAAGDCEIIVVDGGSDDGTFDRAASADKCLATPAGRATQQNAGAVAATGDVLLFLHADCRLPATALASIRSALTDDWVIAGCFRQHIDAPGWRYRLIERGNAARVRLFKWAYGDQAIFVRRSVFTEVGGFPSLKLMEDLYLMKTLKRRGRIALLGDRVETSARRWQKKGLVRQTLRNWTLITLAQLGVSPDWLARFYPHVR